MPWGEFHIWHFQIFCRNIGAEIFVAIGPVVLKKVFPNSIKFLLFLQPFIWTNLNPLHSRCFVLSSSWNSDPTMYKYSRLRLNATLFDWFKKYSLYCIIWVAYVIIRLTTISNHSTLHWIFHILMAL